VEDIEPLTDAEELAPIDVTGKVVRAYLGGDPLRSIAAAANLGSYQVLRLLSSRIADRGEMERSRSLRRRCFSTAEALRNEEHLIGQLRDSGIARSNIPKILAALGTSVDIDIAVELLRDPEGLFANTPRLDGADPSPPTDELSPYDRSRRPAWSPRQVRSPVPHPEGGQ
jgi:hypothetical protein